MFILFNNENPRSFMKRYRTCCSFLGALTFCLFIILVLATLLGDIVYRVNMVYIDTSSTLPPVDRRFLSVALDSVVVADGFHNFDPMNPNVITLMRGLTPGYLRVGGTLADRLVYSPLKEFQHKLEFDEEYVDICMKSQYKFCNILRYNYTMTGEEWMQLVKLSEMTGLELIFDLNSLRRFDNGSWNPRNAERLIKYSELHKVQAHWELGNEPNAYRKQFGYPVAPSQLAQDFETLKEILLKYPQYKNSLLLGPDVTRPRKDHTESEIYLEDFLKSRGGQAVSAVTWHQYYFNGREAAISNFLDPDAMDVLKWQIQEIKSITWDSQKPNWLGETSSAFGGGAPGLSNTYVSTFIWLDKLGMAALHGVDVVVRQSIFRGHYALINEDYSPAPDYWISLAYKKLVSPQPVRCHLNTVSTVRLYCHCSSHKFYESASSITVFGVNLDKKKAQVRLEGMHPYAKSVETSPQVFAYVFTGFSGNLQSSDISLNGNKLELTTSGSLPELLPNVVNSNPYLEMPPYSSVFWVVPAEESSLC